ncbi:hypothetical protein Q2T94_01505 [Paeniglutamicibacter sulfureus]|uniref:hypothetical protein n=1 Tax=Paeniglutamicibacter sulfureus TaxID=43666 RepID=UPI0026650A9A|nr:hypothetical protein [Paeniglutamicibacter sulfureus]MDO2932982.1 hypothetical protein [Paeniglutamicibacter sulfureus]
MSRHEELEPLRIDGLEALPTGRFQYSVRVVRSGRELGAVRLCDDHRFEATTRTGSFAGVHRTLAEAMEALASGAMDDTAQVPEARPAPDPAPVHRNPTPLGRIRPVRRGVYIGLKASRSAAP